jgi:acetyl esterase/lipase
LGERRPERSGAFDDAEDFARHDFVQAAKSAPAAFEGEPIWLDAGNEDPFRPGDQTFAAALRSDGAKLTVRTWPGGHENSYWNSPGMHICASMQMRSVTAAAEYPHLEYFR